MLKKLVSIGFLSVLLTSCGYDGHFRYPCQDSANWGKEECKPPVCSVAGACPEDLVGEDIVNGTETTDIESSDVNE